MASLVSSLVGGARRSVSSAADISQVRKTFFNPLLSNKTAIIELLSGLPIGSAHPYSPERIILVRTRNGVQEIDISRYPEDYFFNAVDLDEMAEVLLGRMARFNHLKVFEDFQIQQAPASTFRVPLVADQITILAVSERRPTYYDFCFADDSSNICCYSATNTFTGLNHSGDIVAGNNDFLAYVTIDRNSLVRKDLCVFISGYNYTPITQFLGTYPALLVANHVEKVLYIVPVPLDEATIGQATLCCPLVIRRERKSLLCSILPTATTDVSKMASGAKLSSPCFREALARADFTISDSDNVVEVGPSSAVITSNASTAFGNATTSSIAIAKKNAIIVTTKATLPESLNYADSQIIEFSTGLTFKNSQASTDTASSTSTVVLPCIFGTQLEGPLLLATGTAPDNVPFTTEKALLDFYATLKTVIVFVDDRMTDNARNLASPWRLNAVYVLQLKPEAYPQTQAQVLDMLDSANINAVTALAGPQSLVLVQISDKYYFYRGLADRKHLNTFNLSFGTDISTIVNASGLESLAESRAERLVNLNDSNTILLPESGRILDATNLKQLFQQLPVEDLVSMVEDISAAVPQLQILLKEKDLADLSNTLVAVLATKVSTIVTPLRDEYVSFLKNDFEPGHPELVIKKQRLLGNFRKKSLETQKALEPVITGLANMMSVRNTSKRTYDLKRLFRKAQIANNVEATKNMTFDTLAGYLETHAMEMGIYFNSYGNKLSLA